MHILEPKPDVGHAMDTLDYLTPLLRKSYQGNLIINGGYTKETANDALARNAAEAIAFGTPFIANPDLVERFRAEAELSQPDSNTFYTSEAKGYTDYQFMQTDKGSGFSSQGQTQILIDYVAAKTVET